MGKEQQKFEVIKEKPEDFARFACRDCPKTRTGAQVMSQAWHHVSQYGHTVDFTYGKTGTYSPGTKG